MEHTFETAMARIEEISKTLSENKISLDESLKLYEEGVMLLSFCNSKLEKAQITITNIEEKL